MLAKQLRIWQWDVVIYEDWGLYCCISFQGWLFLLKCWFPSFLSLKELISINDLFPILNIRIYNLKCFSIQLVQKCLFFLGLILLQNYSLSYYLFFSLHSPKEKFSLTIFILGCFCSQSLIFESFLIYFLSHKGSVMSWIKSQVWEVDTIASTLYKYQITDHGKTNPLHSLPLLICEKSRISSTLWL